MAALLAGNDNESAFARYESAVKLAQSFGFAFRSVVEVPALPVEEVERRLAVIEENKDVALVVDAIDEPAPRLSSTWSLYERHNAAGLTGMSKAQLRKHKTSRERAIRYASDVLGDAELGAINRKDVLQLRDWWTGKIARKGLTAYSANRCFSDMMGMLSVIDDALHTDFTRPGRRRESRRRTRQS